MDQPGTSAAADFRQCLGSGPDFEALENSRPREAARVINLDPVDSAVEGVGEP